LGTDERIGSVTIAENATQALRTLADSSVDVVFSDIKMPGLSGLDLARAAAERRPAPRIVFVTAYDIHAVDAFELAATDYLMKPVRPQRLREAVRRVIEESEAAAVNEPDESIPVELAGVTRFVQRSEVRYVEAQGDYARLHTDAGSHLVRVPLNTLEERWASAGFVRIHRSTLIQLDRVSEVRLDSGRCNVTVAGVELAVSRRHTRALRDLLREIDVGTLAHADHAVPNVDCATTGGGRAGLFPGPVPTRRRAPRGRRRHAGTREAGRRPAGREVDVGTLALERSTSARWHACTRRQHTETPKHRDARTPSRQPPPDDATTMQHQALPARDGAGSDDGPSRGAAAPSTATGQSDRTSQPV
jgi:DNA-binding LytR/AlgR family response regulator